MAAWPFSLAITCSEEKLSATWPSARWALNLRPSKELVRIIMPVKWLLIALDQAVEVLALIGVIPWILLRCSTGFGGRLVAADSLQHLLLGLFLELPAGIGR